LSKKTLPPKDNYYIKKIKHMDQQLYNLANNFLLSKNSKTQETAIKEILNYLKKYIGTPITQLTTTAGKETK
jgi:hypothetical protein